MWRGTTASRPSLASWSKKFFVKFLENAVKTARWQDYISRKVMRQEVFHRLVDFVLCGGKG